MNWFAYQRSPNGLVPVTFDERPNKDWDSCNSIIWETLKEIPEKLRAASIDELVQWDVGGQETEIDTSKYEPKKKEYQQAPGTLAKPNTEGIPPPDPVTEAIRVRFLQRQRVGWTKYGIGLGRDDFTMDNWLQHLEEELMDALQYTVRLRMTLDGSLKITGSADDIKVEQELPAQEIARLTHEIGDRQARIMRLVGGDIRQRVEVPTEPVVYSHPNCIFKYCPDRGRCEPESTCISKIGESDA